MQLLINKDSLSYIISDLMNKGVTQEGDGLYYKGLLVAKFVTSSQNEPSFSISGNRHRDLAILDWFFNPNKRIRQARGEDLETVLILKEEIASSNFTFLDEQSRKQEALLVANLDITERDIRENNLWIAEKDGQPWAIGGIGKEVGGDYTIFSGYSKGNKAGAALLSYIIFWAKSKGVEKVFAHTHEDNAAINQELQAQGFSKTGQFRKSKYSDLKRVNYWSLGLK